MIDLHCHVLPIDDGAKDIEEAVGLIEEAIKIGYTDLCCTSHYKIPEYINENYNKILDELRDEIKKKNLKINLIPGNELYLTQEGLETLKTGVVKTIGSGNYLLVEAIPGMVYGALKNMLIKVKELGYRPVLAHVERYPYIDMEKLVELKKMGVITQVNIRSLGTRDEIFRWIELGLVDILGSDAHNLRYRNYDFREVLRELEKRVGKEIYELLLRENPKKILENQKIEEKFNEEKIIDNEFNSGKFFKNLFARIKLRGGSK